MAGNVDVGEGRSGGSATSGGAGAGPAPVASSAPAPAVAASGDAYTPRAFKAFTALCLVVGLALFQPVFCFKSALAAPQVQGYFAAKYGQAASPSGMEALPENLWGAGEAVYRVTAEDGREARVSVSFDGLASEVEGDDFEADEASGIISGVVLSGLGFAEGEVSSCASWPAGRFAMTPVMCGRCGVAGWMDDLPWCSVVFLPHGRELPDVPGGLELPGKGALVVAWLEEDADPTEAEMRAWAEEFVNYSGYQGWGEGNWVESWDVVQVDGVVGDESWG